MVRFPLPGHGRFAAQQVDAVARGPELQDLVGDVQQRVDLDEELFDGLDAWMWAVPKNMSASSVSGAKPSMNSRVSMASMNFRTQPGTAVACALSDMVVVS
ncbi:hypothetical protein ACFC01_29455 [Streptomyces mirabilis]|uniref:hypothetical protein n=1 Tax=Streptomyces mirabilis TaxID=68239 RepID=UPI0035DD0A46